MTRTASVALAWMAGLTLVGCAVPRTAMPDGAREVPPRWQAPGDAVQAPSDPVTQAWWHGFGSRELDGFIRRAEAQSADVAVAVARLRQAEASARQAGASLWPQVTASLSAGQAGRWGGRGDAAGRTFGAGLTTSYEVDFWGRHQAQADAARAQWQASVHDRDTVRLGVVAGVADLWFQAQALREREALAGRNLATAERLLSWLETRARAGSASALELAQQRGLVASQRRAVAALEQQGAATRSALAALLGQPALDEASLTRSWDALQVPRIDIGLPTQLLTRRPDIAQAEALLEAAQANVAAARAALLPSFTLQAGLGTGGSRADRVLSNPLYTLAANLAAPLFDAGRLQAGEDLALAQRDELLARYRQAIVAALADVEVAWHALDRLQAQSEAQAEVVVQAQRALVWAERRHASGADTLLPLLDAQRTLYTAQDEALSLQLARLQACVSLFKALGGGWTAGEPVEQAAAR